MAAKETKAEPAPLTALRKEIEAELKRAEKRNVKMRWAEASVKVRMR